MIMKKTEKKNKHITLAKDVIEVLDDFADITQRKQTVIYEIALKEYIIQNKNKILKAGVAAQKVSSVIGN